MNGLIQWSPGVTLASIEKQVVLAAFRFYRGNKTQTAQALGIAVRTLDNKLELYAEDVDSEQKRKDDDATQRAERLDRARNGRASKSPDNVYDGRRDDDSARTNGPSEPTYAKAPPSAERPSVAAGSRVEPLANSPAQPAVPMPERPKVQEVLPRHAPHSGPGRRR